MVLGLARVFDQIYTNLWKETQFRKQYNVFKCLYIILNTMVYFNKLKGTIWAWAMSGSGARLACMLDKKKVELGFEAVFLKKYTKLSLGLSASALYCAPYAFLINSQW